MLEATPEFLIQQVCVRLKNLHFKQVPRAAAALIFCTLRTTRVGIVMSRPLALLILKSKR